MYYGQQTYLMRVKDCKLHTSKQTFIDERLKQHSFVWVEFLNGIKDQSIIVSDFRHQSVICTFKR